MSTYVVVEISPETTTRPVLTRVLHETRPYGSSRRTASSTPSEIWSATLSGWPSVTDSDVNRNSLSANWVMRPDRLAPCLLAGPASPLAALVEVDDQRHAVHAVTAAQSVLDEVRVVAGHAGAGVDRDGEPRRALADLGHVEHPQAVAADRGWLPRLDHLPEETIELGRGDPLAHPVAQGDRLAEQAGDVAPADGAGGQDLRAQPHLALHARALVIELGLVAGVEVPFVEDQQGRAVAAHRQLGDPQVLAGHAVGGVADDHGHVRAFGRPLRAQRGVVLDRFGDLGLAAQAGRVDQDQLTTVDVERQVDRVAGRARHLGDDHPLGAHEAVDQRALADVRPADHRQADDVVVLLRRVALGQQLDDPVQQVAGSE